MNRVLLEHSHTHLLMIIQAAFVLQQQSWVVATETIWFTKPQIFTIWLFTGRISQFLV